jgi:hypothetical protein
MLLNEISDHLVRTSRVMMKIDVMARVWMKIRNERPCVLVKCPRRLFEYPLAFTVAHNVVLFASYSQGWSGEVGRVWR